MNNFIQYELWKDCKNGCKFCFNKGQPDLDKLKSLKWVQSKLIEKEVDDYNEVGFIGGEFFDDQINNEEVKKEFYRLFEICKDKIEKGKICKIYLTTSLIYDVNKLLIPFLDTMKEWNILNKILICTSYESKYRFHTKEKEDLWKSNMLKLHDLYPELGLHTEMIVTQFFIDEVLNDTFSISKFKETYHTEIDYIEPASGFYYIDKKDMYKDYKDFFPTKKSFIQFVIKTAVKSNDIHLYKFLSMNIRSDKVYCYLDGTLLCLDSRRKTNKGFIDAKKDAKIKYEMGFIDSDDKMIDVVKELAKTYGENL